MRSRSKSKIAFDIVNYTIFIVFSLSILIPFFNVISISLSSPSALASGNVTIWPQGFNLDGYKQLFNSPQFLRTGLNSVFLTAVNTVLVILLSLAAGYALSNKNMIGKHIIFIYLLIPMYFSGGLIPTYLLVNTLGLNNTYGALILPAVINIFYIIVFKNTIDQLPKELLESAEIDGASEYSILFRITLPLIIPMAMAFVVFSAVNYWNEWFAVLIYIRDRSMWTLQFQLRDILINANLVDQATQDAIASNEPRVHSENLKMAALMVTILPIIIVYPFVQKYFIHGQLVGAVKG